MRQIKPYLLRILFGVIHSQRAYDETEAFQITPLTAAPRTPTHQ